MTQRLKNTFAKLKQESRAGLVTFITAGDPNLETSRKILHGLPQAGADIIELGMPFSDPMADGPAIQFASLRALQNGGSMTNTLDMVREFRQQDDKTPLVLMGYYNPIYQFGNQKFLESALAAGVDGLIIVDLPPEEDDELCHSCLIAGLNWIRLISPTSDDSRLTTILRNSSGFVYYVSITGVTGTRSANLIDTASAVGRIRTQTCLPVAVGFGVKNSSQIHEISKFADATVVGSALVDIVKAGLEVGKSGDSITADLLTFVTELAAGTH